MCASISVSLQPAVPYARHLGWDLSRSAYAAAGSDSWQDVPYQITNNAAFAGQLARLLFLALGPRAGEPVNVLELGAGSGAFAYHFVAAFEGLCRQQGHACRLRYLISDAVSAHLADLSENPCFEPLFATGRLERIEAELTEPGVLRDANGARLAMPDCDLLLMNYLLCHQPFELWRARRGSNGHEQGLIATEWALELPESAEGLQARLVQRLAGLGQLPDAAILEDLLQDFPAAESLLPSLTSQAQASRLRLFPSEQVTVLPADSAWLGTLLEGQPGRWVMYPRQALMALEAWLAWLKPQGLLLISDKGWSDGERSPVWPEPSTHGRHLAWPVHFPLLAAWCDQQGLSARHTRHPLWTLHTLLAVKGRPVPELELAFAAEFEQHNANLYAAELIDSAEAVEDTDPRKAAMLYTQALAYRPADARIVHQLIACLFELQAFGLAAAYLATPVVDLFNQYDFAFQQGQLALFQGDYVAAIAGFERSIVDYGPEASSYYNLGLSQMLAHRPAEARFSFELALALAPEHALARAALQSWQETFGSA